MLRTKAPQRPKRQREDTFANHVPRARTVARGSPELAAALDGIAALELRPIIPKTPERKSQAIRDSANGEQCLVRLPGCIGHAIWSHNRHGRAGKGGGIKALDLNGCYCCTSCDAIYDGQRSTFLTRDEVELAWYHAHAESLCKLAQKGLLK
jgi:hypothetical protein